MILVSYFHKIDDNQFGFGETLMSDRLPSSVDDVNNIRGAIQSLNPEMNVVAIMSIVPLRRWWQFWK